MLLPSRAMRILRLLVLALPLVMACGDDSDTGANGPGGAGGQGGTGGKGGSGQAGSTQAGKGGSGLSGSSGQPGAGSGGSAAGSAGGPAGGGGQPGAGSGGGPGAGSGGGPAAGSGGTSTGLQARVGTCGAKQGRYFPEATWMYQDVSAAPLRANSAATTKWLVDQGGWGLGRMQIDTSFVVLEADASTPKVDKTPDDPVEYSSDCDPGVKFPLPAGGIIEGQTGYVCPGRAAGDYEGDCHLIVADLGAGHLYEAYRASYEGGKFYSECSIDWNMQKDVWGAPPAPASVLPPVASLNWGIGRDCTGPDAAGFPMAPLLFSVEEVKEGKIEHAIRFILPNERMQKAPAEGAEGPVYVWPATHAGGPKAIDPDAPIYGSRWRLKASFDPAARGLDPDNQVVKAVVYGLKKYGMLLSDGGSVALTAESDALCGTKWDSLWGEKGSRVLEGIQPDDFEIIDTGGTEAGYDCERAPR